MRVVIGVDAGGSKTRALALREDGKVVGYAETGGGNPEHNSVYRENIEAAIRGACSGFALSDVKAIVSGIAGIDRPTDHVWAEAATDIDGISAQRLQINDADIALFGALEGGPGIVSIQGHGSMVMAKTESGRQIRNFDLLHYANAAGPKIGLRATHAALSGMDAPEEGDFKRQILEHWRVESVLELRERAANEWLSNRDESLRVAGGLAPAVTRAAEEGLPTALRLCEMAAGDVVQGIRLLGPFFEGSEVFVVLSGSCVTSCVIGRFVETGLASALEKTYRVVEPKFTAVQGAALWALQLAGGGLSDAVKTNIR